MLIHRLLADYGPVVDDHDWARAHEVFAEDFVFDRSATGRPDLHGIADIVANFLGRNMYAHVTTNITLTEIDAGPFESVVVLGTIVLIRVILSFSLEVEIDGMWPWNRWRIPTDKPRPDDS